MSDSNALGTWANEPLRDAIQGLRDADAALCRIVAGIAEARGWRLGEPYETTPLEQPWHDLILRVGNIRDELQGHVS